MIRSVVRILRVVLCYAVASQINAELSAVINRIVPDRITLRDGLIYFNAVQQTVRNNVRRGRTIIIADLNIPSGVNRNRRAVAECGVFERRSDRKHC